MDSASTSTSGVVGRGAEQFQPLPPVLAGTPKKAQVEYG